MCRCCFPRIWAAAGSFSGEGLGKEEGTRELFEVLHGEAREWERGSVPPTQTFWWGGGGGGGGEGGGSTPAPERSQNSTQSTLSKHSKTIVGIRTRGAL